jgi:hypothetical protein
MHRRKQRFGGAGGSTTREFKRQRLRNVRDSWRIWLLAAAVAIGLAAWSLVDHGLVARLLAASTGFLVGAFFFAWSFGGHVSSFPWLIGAEGERETAKAVEKLGAGWHCEHDLEYAHGNWDHILVGPAGVFLLDSKSLNGTSAAGGDGLRSGRLVFRGATLRAAAKRLKYALEGRLGSRAPWVQAVFVVWGDFPQLLHEEQDVVYIHGLHLRTWLSELPTNLNAPRRAALVTALREVRESLPGKTATAARDHAGAAAPS